MKASPVGSTVAFTVAALAKAALVFSCALQYGLLLRAPVRLAEAQANDTRQQIISVLSALLAIVALIVFLCWFYRTKKIAIGAGMTGVKYSPGLSAGCFFIPFANLVLPFQAMRELWRGSLNPVGWREESPSLLVGWWWAGWLAYSFSPMVALLYSKLNSGLEALKTTTILLAICGVFAAINFTVTIVLVVGISRQLNDAIDRPRRESPNLPPDLVPPLPDSVA